MPAFILQLDPQQPLMDQMEGTAPIIRKDQTYTISTHLYIRKSGNCFIEWLRYLVGMDSTSSWGYKRTAAKLHALLESHSVQIPASKHEKEHMLLTSIVGDFLQKILHIQSISENRQFKVNPAFTKNVKTIENIKKIYENTLDFIGGIKHSDEVIEAQRVYLQARADFMKTADQQIACQKQIEKTSAQIKDIEAKIAIAKAKQAVSQDKKDAKKQKGLKGLTSQLTRLQKNLEDKAAEKEKLVGEERSRRSTRDRHYQYLIRLQPKTA